MKLALKLALLVLVTLVCSGVAHGQYVTITGTVKDSAGCVYAGASGRAVLVPPYANYMLNNSPMNPGLQTVVINNVNSFGQFSLQVANTNNITPVSQNPMWQFSFNSQDGKTSFTMVPMVLTSSQDISAQIQLQAAPLNCGGGGGGGTVTGTGTPNDVTKWITATSIGNSSGFDDGVNVAQWGNGLSIMARPLAELYTNGGVTASTLVKIVAGSAVPATSADAEDVYGIALPNGGSVVQISIAGQTPCIFDNQSVPGDYAVLSSGSAPECHDTGSVTPVLDFSNIGRVVSTNSGSGTTAIVDLQLPGVLAASNSTSFPPQCTYGVTPVTTNYTAQTSDACHDLDITGASASQTIILPQPGTNGVETYTGHFGQNLICTTATTCTSTTFNATAGQSIIAQATVQTGPGAATVTDSVGDVFTQIGSTLNPQSGYYMAMYWTPHSAGGIGVTLTATLGSPADTLQIMGAAFANVLSLDQTAGQTGGETAGIQSPTIVTTSSSEILVGIVTQACGAPSNPISGYSNIVAGQFMYAQVGFAGPYVGGLAETCNAPAAWAAQVASFVVNGAAPQYANGFWVWVSNHSTQSWAVDTLSADIIACDGTSTPSVTVTSGEGIWFESDGANWRTACGQSGGGGGSGTVTSVATTSPITGGPITTTGTIACATCTTNAAALTANELLIGGGSQATAVLGSLGTTTTVLHGNAAGAPSYGAVGLTTDVTGTLPEGNLPFTYTTTNGATELLTVSGAFTNGHCIAMGANGNAVDNGSACGSGGGGGTVTSVGLALPASLFTVSGSPVTTTGTLTGTLISTVPADEVFGNCTGSTGTPNFCALTAAMIPTINVAFTNLTSGTNTAAAMVVGTGASLATSGSGTIAATSAPFSGLTSGTNSTAAMVIGTGASLGVSGTGANTSTAFTPAGTSGDCVKWGTSGALADAGAACGVTGINITVNGGSNVASPANFITGAATNGTTIVANQSGSNISFTDTGARTIAGGGTGQTTAINAFNALSPMTTAGDEIIYSGGTATRLPIGANGNCEIVVSGLPAWGTCSPGSITGSGTTNNFALFTSATSIGSGPLSVSGTTISTSDTIAAPSFSATGSGAMLLTGTEGTCLGAVSGSDVLCLGDATSHTAQISNNGGTFYTVARSVTVVSSALGGISQPNGGCTATTVAVTGATSANRVLATPVADPGAGFYWTAFVSSANTVTLRVCNASGTTGTPASVAYNLQVFF